jgi:tRNA pseudouridine(38-40) synthase
MQMDAKLVEESGEKFVSFKLQGQSFIYHQIRKMMGILVMIF